MMDRQTDDLDFMEGKRLRRLGIDLDANPVEIMRQVDQLMRTLRSISDHTITEPPPLKQD